MRLAGESRADRPEILDIPLLCQTGLFYRRQRHWHRPLGRRRGHADDGICGPTDPRRVKPLGDNVTAVQADLPCVNCYRKTCSHHSCMAMLTPSRIWRHLRALNVRPGLHVLAGESA
ncbi:MAG: hypothetical protein IPK63_09720 [Candidatus Competibacteraceae bacterium]|nr:hypothetical protein [Candidatus Competibacteraceae bacterium]